MTDLSLEQRIAFAAIQYDRARCGVKRIAKKRSTFSCERAECDYDNRDHDQYRPCWRTYRSTYDGDHKMLPIAEWCESCRQRQTVYADYQKATVKRGARLRELHRLCELAGGWQIAPTIQLLAVSDGWSSGLTERKGER